MDFTICNLLIMSNDRKREGLVTPTRVRSGVGHTSSHVTNTLFHTQTAAGSLTEEGTLLAAAEAVDPPLQQLQ